MEAYTAGDIEGGFTTVTPMLFIGRPPTIDTWDVTDPKMGAWLIQQRSPVSVNTSEEAIAVLTELGLVPEEIEWLLHAARYGLMDGVSEEDE